MKKKINNINSIIKKKYKYELLENGFSKKDIDLGKKVLDSKRITMAENTNKFEVDFAKKLGVKYALMVNSGSSANLLAAFAGGNLLRKNRYKPGDEFLIPVLCWSTSLWPFVQFGLKPIFVDIDKETLNISIYDLKKKMTSKTRAIVLINVLGNCSNLFEIKKFAKKNNLIVIEDNCESLGSKLKKKFLGTFGDFGTYSFYYSHQITSGEGGMITCTNDKDYEILFSLRSHGWFGGTRFYQRRLKKYNSYAKTYSHLDPRYIFTNSGFNLRPTDIQAVIAHNQFKRLNSLKKIRSFNRSQIINKIKNSKKWNNQFLFFEPIKNLEPSWMGLPILINERLERKKRKFIEYLDHKGIETRPIISGSFINQPAAKLYGFDKKKDKFANAQYIQDLGFLIGLHTKKITQDSLNLIHNSFFNIENL
jgi:CDP-6-deoxy-D-xylo-4-hexulose-3-dehydrase